MGNSRRRFGCRRKKKCRIGMNANLNCNHFLQFVTTPFLALVAILYEEKLTALYEASPTAGIWMIAIYISSWNVTSEHESYCV